MWLWALRLWYHLSLFLFCFVGFLHGIILETIFLFCADCLPQHTILSFSQLASFPDLKKSCQILPSTAQHFLLPRLFKMLLRKQNKHLKHLVSPLRRYRMVTVGFSEKRNTNMLTGTVKSIKRQKDGRVCNKYLLNAWQNSQT